MWVLYQSSICDNRKKQFVVSSDYDKLIEYIYSFSDVKRYGDNKFISKSNIVFDLYLCEVL